MANGIASVSLPYLPRLAFQTSQKARLFFQLTASRLAAACRVVTCCCTDRGLPSVGAFKVDACFRTRRTNSVLEEEGGHSGIGLLPYCRIERPTKGKRHRVKLAPADLVGHGSAADCTKVMH
jgi:hypothetical protein